MPKFIDPVHHDPTDDKWYFWDETWSDRHGPYVTEALARAYLERYIVMELGNIREGNVALRDRDLTPEKPFIAEDDDD
jgi:hypothetical protein